MTDHIPSRPKLHLKNKGSRNRNVSRQKPKLSGHDKTLQEIIDGGLDIKIIFMSGESIVGRLVAWDKFTLSVNEYVNAPFDRTTDDTNGVVVYKHAIKKFEFGNVANIGQ